MLKLAPVGQFSLSEQGFGGPACEVNRQGDAVSAVASEDERLGATRVAVEDGFPRLDDQDWSAPAMAELAVAQDRVEAAHAPLETRQQLDRPARADVNRDDLAPVGQSRDAASPDHPL